MRLVIDSNVIIAAFAVRGLCHAVFEYCLESHDVILCESILGEVRKNLRKKIKVPDRIIEEIDEFLRDSAVVEKPMKVPGDVFRDKTDLDVLGVAVSSGASYIVTGDKALLALKSYKDTGIISPRGLWELAGKKAGR
jgi:putative PIN family toxin of toxin-antitoxin system